MVFRGGGLVSDEEAGERVLMCDLGSGICDVGLETYRTSQLSHPTRLFHQLFLAYRLGFDAVKELGKHGLYVFANISGNHNKQHVIAGV